MMTVQTATRSDPGSPRTRRFPRPTWKVETLVLVCVSFLLLTGNAPFWRAALAERSWQLAASWGFAAALFVAFAAFYFVFTSLLATRLTVRPLLSVLVLCTAFASWYMDHYAIYLDRAMLRNVLATHVNEARELLVWGMVPHLLLLGVLPAALIWWPQLKQRSIGRALAIRLGWVTAALVIGAVSLLLEPREAPLVRFQAGDDVGAFVAVNILDQHLRAAFTKILRVELPHRIASQRRRLFPPAFTQQNVDATIAVQITLADAVRVLVPRAFFADRLPVPRFLRVAPVGGVVTNESTAIAQHLRLAVTRDVASGSTPCRQEGCQIRTVANAVRVVIAWAWRRG